MDKEPLARSASHGRRQTYAEHVLGTVGRAMAHYERMEPYMPEASRAPFRQRLLLAALYHDLGKLEARNQAALLRDQRGKRLPYPHHIAGANLLQKGGLGFSDTAAAAAVYAHHAELPDLLFEENSDLSFCHDQRNSDRRQLYKYTIANLDKWLAQHDAVVGVRPEPPSGKLTSLGVRMLFSCLVDADWSDAANRAPRIEPPPWAKLRQALDAYARNLSARPASSESERQRNQLRAQLYEAMCDEAAQGAQPRVLDAPVGSGKTIAALAWLLRAAQARELRHVVLVFPYTSILAQAERTCREAFAASGEDMDRILAVHHHRADYRDRAMRDYATNWEAPIILTTSVQFFETLAANRPEKLRKLHQLAGSAVFIDEYHAAAPAKCLPPIWNWLNELTRDWHLSVLLASGTSVRFWAEHNFRVAFQAHCRDIAPPRILPGESLRQALNQLEKNRVRLHPGKADGFAMPEFQTVDELIDFALAQPGPRIILMNTRFNAAYVANRLRQRGLAVRHLSNAFRPMDLTRILDEVSARQALARKDPAARDWTLVATSYACMGLDLSFCSGFCLLMSCALFLQFCGRVGRHCEYADAALWCFQLFDAALRSNPTFQMPAEKFQGMIKDHCLDTLSPSELANDAFQREKFSNDWPDFLKYEQTCAFQTMAHNFHIIEDKDDILAVVEGPELELLREGKRLTPGALQQACVSIGAEDQRALGLRPLPGIRELYVLPASLYDPNLLGYFKTLL